ncbi:MAG: hypothetical protein GEU73_12145 [Chloroflexi bacterium]|nr:hypothetical protein [Chloroflexota bacterium]
MRNRSFVLPLVMFLVITACAPATAPGAGPMDEGGQQVRPSQTLRMVIRQEPGSIAGTILSPTGISTGTQRRIFNAGLALEGGDGTYRPYLAESLPQLNTDSWKILPDGRMETTYRLRQDIVWHDGTPITAEDFAFARSVYRNTSFGVSGSFPHTVMDDVTAPDPHTVVITWREAYPRATELDQQRFAPLPRHILEAVYDQERADLENHSFWTTEFVSAGPYQLDRWEPGAFIEGKAFDRHVLGRPQIDRVELTWSADFNANLARLLAGEADMPADDSIRVEQGLVLEREWAAQNAGTVQYRPHLPRFVQVQHRAEFADPQAVRDVRVRQALAHAIDKGVINDTLFDGKGITSDSLIYPTVDYSAIVERAVPRYPFDIRRTEQLMSEAGYAKDAGGFWASPTEGRLNFEARNIQSAQNDAERSIIADGWRRAGFETSEDVFTTAQSREGEPLGTFRSLSITSAAAEPEGLKLDDYRTQAISRPETRWFGQNRGGWSNPEYDRVATAWLTSLDPAQRGELAGQTVAILMTDLGLIPLHFNPGVIAQAAKFTGISVTAPSADPSWNIHEWKSR